MITHRTSEGYEFTRLNSTVLTLMSSLAAQSRSFCKLENVNKPIPFESAKRQRSHNYKKKALEISALKMTNMPPVKTRDAKHEGNIFFPSGNVAGNDGLLGACCLEVGLPTIRDAMGIAVLSSYRFFVIK
ncbi:hypothetical protein BaRGS_00004112, partial [Batillaria attramentaria]